MMRKTVISLLFACCIATSTKAQDNNDTPIFKYRISLTDKSENGYSVDKPEDFLSQKAIERRNRQGIRIDETDLPITAEYVKKISKLGVKFLHCSKWNNTVVVQTSDTTCMKDIRSLKFVKGVKQVAYYAKPVPVTPTGRKEKLEKNGENIIIDHKYGKASNQILQLNGDELHDLGFRGNGMTIAVIDGGFYNADIIPALKNTKILGTKDFVNPNSDIYAENAHGMKVLSCMGCNENGIMIGTAPEASYWLLRSEDSNTEQLVEEDNWNAAVEYADSVGVDVINTSLGYYNYDNDDDDVKYWELDGESHIISHTASMIASKGMILVTSAGNEGDDAWKKISVPADAKDILAVGAVTVLGENTLFSSVGNTEDGRIKPDVCAMGGKATVIDINGHTKANNGTSFASPILAGMVACLWQALPNLNAYEIMDIVRKSGNYAEHPNNIYGYGIPDFMKALNMGK